MSAQQSKVTIHDIARKARVSASTVSRAFNPAERHRISQKTRERIYAIAERHGYRPNPIARALSSGGSNTIALILPGLSGPTIDNGRERYTGSEYYAQVLMHAVAVLSSSNMDLKVHTLRFGETDETFTELLHDLAVDGMIIVGMPMSERFRITTESPLPIVLLNSYREARLTGIDADNIMGGRLAAECLIQNGHTALGMLSGPENSRNAVDRTNGFKDYLREQKKRIHAKWFIHCDYSSASGYAAFQHLLQCPDKPTGVFCANDEIAFGALQAIRDAGLHCPDDISLIGFDNTHASAYTSPPLTTIEQPIATMANAALEYLLETLNNPKPVLNMAFPVTLVERSSVRRRSV